MYKVSNYLRNYVKIRVTGYKPQRFINICLRRFLPIWELKQISENEFTLCMRALDFKKNVRSAAAKADIKVTIIKKVGLLFTLKRYEHRKLFAILSFFMILLFVYLNSCVWSITIDGADITARENIIRQIDDMGIKKGMLMSKVDTKQLAEIILYKQKNLSWVGVKKYGTTLKINIVEATHYKEEKGEEIPSDEPCNIAVSKDCLLYKVVVEEGIQEIETGNTALAGQTVISGDGKHAQGAVLGCVWYKAEVLVEPCVEQLVYTGKEQKNRAILLFGLRLGIPQWKWLPWNWNREKYENYDCMYYEDFLEYKKKLPIGIATEIKKETSFYTKNLGESEAKNYAIIKAQTVLDSIIPEQGNILKTKGMFKEIDGKLYYVLVSEVLENVGITVG